MLKRAVEQAQRQLRAYRTRWKAFLKEQGFHGGAEDCLPDPPGKELKPMIPKGLTWEQHIGVWRRAWARYGQSFATNVNEQPQGEGNAGSADATDMRTAMGNLAGRYFKPQTKEGVLNAAGELKEAVLGEGAGSKDAAKRVQEKAKDMFNIFQESTSSFVEGYREAVDLHERDEKRPQRPPAPESDGGDRGRALAGSGAAVPPETRDPPPSNDSMVQHARSGDRAPL